MHSDHLPNFGTFVRCDLGVGCLSNKFNITDNKSKILKRASEFLYHIQEKMAYGISKADIGYHPHNRNKT